MDSWFTCNAFIDCWLKMFCLALWFMFCLLGPFLVFGLLDFVANYDERKRSRERRRK